MSTEKKYTISEIITEMRETFNQFVNVEHPDLVEWNDAVNDIEEVLRTVMDDMLPGTEYREDPKTGKPDRAPLFYLVDAIIEWNKR